MRLFAVGMLVIAGGTVAAAQRRREVPPVFPVPAWTFVDTAQIPDAAERATLESLLHGGDTSAMMIVVHGRVVFRYGRLDEVSYIASARKSVTAMLYGKYVADGTVRLDATMASLGIDDDGGLLPIERTARVSDLLAARSGIYHPAANLGDASDRAPARGAVRPGSHFLYNNWDFNALESILERATGREVYALVTADLATPLGMEDWNGESGAYASLVRNDTHLSRYPAHHLALSTRDMARLGYLMLRQGRWNGRQVIPADWVRRITSTVTPAPEVARTSPFIDGLGYGYLWWLLQGPPFARTALAGAYTASGAFGQYITVIPSLDAVVVHKTVAPSQRNVTNEMYFGTILPAASRLAAAAAR